MQAIGRFRVDFSQCEAELRKVLGERDDLQLLCSKKEEAIKDLQADLAKVREERVELDQQVSLVLLKYGFDSTVEVNHPLSQLQQMIERIRLLREEVDQIRDECNQWKETIDRPVVEKETILTKLLSADVQLRNVKQKVSVQTKKIDELEIRLAEAKAEAESSKVLADKSIAVYRADAEAAQVEAREAAKIADARAHWVAELVKSAPWMPQAVPDLEDWVRKLASTSSYAERAWRDLAKGVTRDAVLRPLSGDEGNKPPIPEQVKEKKQRASSRSEDPKPKTRTVRRKIIALSIDSVHRLREEEEEDNSSALVVRPTGAVEVVRAAEPMAAVPIRVGSEVLSLDRSTPSDLLGAMAMGHSPSLLSFSEEALKEARELKTPDIGTGSGAADPFKDCFTGVDDSSDIGDASLLLEEAQRFITRAIGRFRVDFSQCEAELRKVLGERDDLQLLCSKKEEAIKDLQADLAKVREERVELDQQVSLVLLKYGFDSTVEVNHPLSQLQQMIERIRLLREEVDQIRAECNQWKETIDRLVVEKETILTKLLSADVQLRNVKQKVSVQTKKIDELEIRLAEAKAEAESSKVLADKSIAVYRADAEAAQVEAREAAKIADARAHWVAELVKSAPWMPQAVPDLEDWVRKLASTSSYAERAWRDLAKGVTRDAVLRPLSGDEGNKPPVPEQVKEKKQRASSRSEDLKPKTRMVRRKIIALSIDSVHRLREEEEEDNSSALVVRPTGAVEVVRAAEPMAAVPIRVGSEVLSLDRSTPSDLLGAMAMGHSPSLLSFSEEALKEARELKTPDIGTGSGAADPFKDCFTGVDDSSDIGDASLLLEEAQHFITRAIGRFRVDFSQCEAELRKVLGERDDLQLLCSKKEEAIKDLQADLAKQMIERIRLLREEVDQIRDECNQWKETIDRPVVEKETILTKLLSADVQLRNVKQKVSVQTKKIDELEIRLAEAKAEAESSKVLADKSIAVYRADAEAAQVEAREAAKIADARAHWVAELVKCKVFRRFLEYAAVVGSIDIVSVLVTLVGIPVSKRSRSSF
ncbi:intracellular protein transport protein USO1-like [Nicotiana tomentosiformis]|uniref:intracellular protein transport protein USO1-like n=1 Tax=Nicotiana tomentosiformis TaxID=4098 RepID=UPI00388C372D